MYSGASNYSWLIRYRLGALIAAILADNLQVNIEHAHDAPPIWLARNLYRQDRFVFKKP